LVFWAVLLDGGSDLRRKRTVDRNIRPIHLRAFLLIRFIRFFRRLFKLLQLLFFLFLLAHVIRSPSFKISTNYSDRSNIASFGRLPFRNFPQTALGQAIRRPEWEEVAAVLGSNSAAITMAKIINSRW
jgi:hypothetical protein